MTALYRASTASRGKKPMKQPIHRLTTVLCVWHFYAVCRKTPYSLGISGENLMAVDGAKSLRGR